MNFNFDFNFDFGADDQQNKVETFAQFCELAGYPSPYEKQEEMRSFAFPDDKEDQIPRLLLGARGYGKTDFVTILGSAFLIYKDRQRYILLVTKEFERGAEIVGEVKAVLEKVGVDLKGKSDRKIYTKEASGKEPTMTSLSVRSKGLRGRHPDMVILEDLITPDDSSEAERKRVQKVYEEILKLTANVVLIGQPVHKLDLFQKLRYLVKTLPVKHGDIPELDADLVAQRAAGVSEQSISASYHLEILDDASLPFGNIKECNYAASNCVAFIDPSFKGGDYTAIAIGGMHFSKIVISGFAIKKAWYDSLEEFKFLFEFFGVKSIRFETNSLGEDPVNKMRLLGAACTGYNSNDNKHARIINAAFSCENLLLHKLEEVDISQLQGDHEALFKDPERFISEIRDANEIFIAQTKIYEYGASFDDAPDSIAGLIRYLGIIN